jgi:DNA helicase HerA-like ATPase
VTLAWDVLNELEAYRVTEIPRRFEADVTRSSQDEPIDPGRTQRLAALIAAYHAGAEVKGNGAGALAIGWIRHGAGGQVQVLAAGAGLVGSNVGQEVFLTLPGGARAHPLLRGTLARLMAQLPSWRTIAGISDGLLPDNEHRTGERPSPSMEECLLAVWPGPFGWLLLAEPLSAAGIQEIADDLAQREQFSTGNSDRFPERAMAARRLNLRHAEIRKGASAGLWRVRLLAGGTDAAAASRVAGLVCASADLAGLPYAMAPANSEARSLQEALEDPGAAPVGGDALPGQPFYASSELIAALSRPPEREMPGIRLALRPDFDVTQEPAAGREAIAVGEILDRSRWKAGPLVLPLDSLNRHVFVSGATGSGKSQTVRALLEAATRAGIPWLVVEPAKAEYRLMAARLAGIGEDPRGTENPETSENPRTLENPGTSGADAMVSEVVRIRPGEPDAIAAGLNPLEPAPDEDGHRFPLQTHADLVKALFVASFRSDEPFPQVLSAALTRVYEDAGWDLALGETVAADANPSYPNLTDLQRAAIRIVQEVGYSQRITDDVLGFIKVRLSSLRLGTTGRFLEGGHQLDFGQLLRTNAVLEIEDVGDDSDKAFLMGTVLIRLAEHLRMANRARPSAPGGLGPAASGGKASRVVPPGASRAPTALRHLTVIEEAHRLLRRPETAGSGASGGSAAHAVEMFAGLLAEIRAYGEGLIIAEQIPDRLIQDVIKNTAVKITHRLPAADDRDAVGATMNMTQAQNRFLVTLKPGEAAVFADGMDFPLLVQMPDGTGREAATQTTTATPAGVVRPRSITCGADCVGRPCTLRDMRIAQRALDEYPAIRLWTQLSVLAHLTGWPMPVPGTALLSLLQLMPSRLRDCAISHGVDAALGIRVPVITGRVSPVGLASHVSTAIRSRVSRGSWLCQREEPQWLAPAYKWTLVLDALRSADRKIPGAGRHPRSPEWERTYGQAITGDTCARQVGTVQRWYDGAQRDGWEMRAVAFGVDSPSEIERAVGARTEDDDFEERLTGYLDQFVDCRWPRLYLTADPLGDPPEQR